MNIVPLECEKAGERERFGEYRSPEVLKSGRTGTIRCGKEMRAMMSYLTYISNGIEVGADLPWRMLNTMKEIPLPSIENGEKLYTEKKLCRMPRAKW